MKLKDFFYNIKFENQTGHCYRSVDGLLMFIGAVLYLHILYGKVATVVFVIQLIFLLVGLFI